MVVLATTNYGLQLALVIGFAVVFGLVVLLPWTLDLVLSHTAKQSETTDGGTKLTGTSGLSRASMAMSVIVVIGFALMYLLVMNPGGQLAKDIVVALTTTLAAVVAFYFGTRMAQEAAATGKQTEPSGSPEAPAAQNGKPEGAGVRVTIKEGAAPIPGG